MVTAILGAVTLGAISLGGCGSRDLPPVVSASAQAAPDSSAPIEPTAIPDLVDIGGGRHMEIHCNGHGGPVVILDAGLGNTSDVWTPLVRVAAPLTTICSYNRAGLGRSDQRSEPHGAASAVADLHDLLRAAGLPAPWIVVGASFGGLDAQLFARRYPSEVGGVVLVDAIAPGWDPGLEALLSPAQVAERRAIPNGEDLTNEDIRESERIVPDGGPFPPVPLVVLRHGQPFPGGPDWPTAKVEALWLSLQEELAGLSPNSRLLFAAESGHRIHEQQPQLVADAIAAIIDPSRWPPTAPSPAPAFGSGAPAVAAGDLSGRLVSSAPDGLRIANAADGSESSLLVAANGRLIGEPSADATGRTIAYTSRPLPGATTGQPRPATGSEVWLLDVPSAARVQLTADGQMPAVSPDGQRIAFGRDGHTYLVGRNGGSATDLGEGGCPVWSPDGTELAMCTAEDEVVILDVASGARRAQGIGGGPNDPLAWSPDGRTLGIFSGRDGNGEVYVADVDRGGSGVRRLTTAPGNQAIDAWLADGLLVTSSAPAADVSDWFLVDPTNGATLAIPWLHGVPNPIAWLPGS
ncbi:MAG: alpha/beta fold hydrolase [Candidatus Limnocylindrales bacterium]